MLLQHYRRTQVIFKGTRDGAFTYKGHYNFIWVTENYIIFWQDETKMYGVIYTNDFKEAKEEIKKWYDGVQFRKIEEGWYELGHFGI